MSRISICRERERERSRIFARVLTMYFILMSSSSPAGVMEPELMEWHTYSYQALLGKKNMDIPRNMREMDFDGELPVLQALMGVHRCQWHRQSSSELYQDYFWKELHRIWWWYSSCRNYGWLMYLLRIKIIPSLLEAYFLQVTSSTFGSLTFG